MFIFIILLHALINASIKLTFTLILFVLFCYVSGYYIDQSDPNYLLTSRATNCSKLLYEKESCSKGQLQAATLFANSTKHEFCQTLDSPFLYSSPNLLLPTVNYSFND